MTDGQTDRLASDCMVSQSKIGNCCSAVAGLSLVAGLGLYIITAQQSAGQSAVSRQQLESKSCREEVVLLGIVAVSCSCRI